MYVRPKLTFVSFFYVFFIAPSPYTIANTKSRGPKLLVFPRSLKVLDVIVSPCNCPALEAASKTLSIYCAWLITKF